MAAPAAEIIPRKSSNGFFLGLSFPAVCCVLAALIILAFATPVFGGFRGIAIMAPVWGPLLALGLVPVSYIDGRAIDWAPIGVSYLIRRATGQHRYRARVWRTRPEGTLGLPGNRAAMKMHVDEATGAVMVHDPHKKTLAVTASVTSSSFLLDNADKKNGKGNGYGRLLSTLGAADGVKLIQILVRSTADAGVDVRRYWARHRVQAGTDDPVQASYRDLLREAASFTERHETTITVVVDLKKIKSAARSYGGGMNGVAAVMRQRMRTLESLLAPAGLQLRGWLTKEDLATAIRCAYDPAAATRLQAHPEQVEDLEDTGPMAVDGGWTQVRTDSARHKVMRIAKWPRAKAEIGFLKDVILVPGTVLATSLLYRPVPAAKAAKDARRESSRELEGFKDRQRAGTHSTVVNQMDQAQAVEHLAELNTGFSDMDHTVLLTVSAPTKEALAKGVEDVRSSVRGVLSEPRTLICQQDELFEAATMPLGLGVR